MLFRLLQGMFGAALVPLSQATLLDIYPREQRGSAMAIWGMGVMVGPILGPDARRLADRDLQLALGVLHQPAVRHPGRRSACSLFMPRDRARDQLRVRLVRLRHAQHRHRRAADDARPRPAARTGSARPRSSSRRRSRGLGFYLFLVHMLHGASARSSSRRCSRTATSSPASSSSSSSASSCWRRWRCCRRTCRT